MCDDDPYEHAAAGAKAEWAREEEAETRKIKLENQVRLQMAASVLREMLPGTNYGITINEFQEITKPLSEAITRILATDD